MTAEEFLLKRLNRKSGTLQTGIMQDDYAAECMEEYARLYQGGQHNFNAYDLGYKDGYNACIKGLSELLKKMSAPATKGERG